MGYKKISFVAGVDDLVIMEPGDYGIIECEGSANKLGGALTKMLTSLKSRALSSGNNEKDFILFNENCFFKIVNFDIKNARMESDYDVIKFEFDSLYSNTKFEYLESKNDTFLFISSDDKIISAAKLENFKFSSDPDSIRFRNGKNGITEKPTAFGGNERFKMKIIDSINNGIDGSIQT